MKKSSKVLEFVALANDCVRDVAANSFPDRVRAVCAAIVFTIEHGFRWDKGDFAELVRLYGRTYRCSVGVVFGVNHIDHWHVLAVRVGNASAVNSVDAHAGQKIVWGMVGRHGEPPRKARLTIGSEFALPDGEKWRLTQLPYQADPEDKLYIRAVHADGRRRRFLIADLMGEVR